MLVGASGRPAFCEVLSDARIYDSPGFPAVSSPVDDDKHVEKKAKLLVSPLTTPVVVPYIIPLYITPLEWLM